MRQTLLPHSFSNLGFGIIIVRCWLCGELVFGAEMCIEAPEQARCPSPTTLGLMHKIGQNRPWTLVCSGAAYRIVSVVSVSLSPMASLVKGSSLTRLMEQGSWHSK